MRLHITTQAVIPVVLLGSVMSVGYWEMASPKQSIDCAHKGTCLPSYNNTRVCKMQRVGTPETELIHQLGQPIKRDGDSLYFEAGATEPGPIEVKLDDQRNAIQLICRPSGLNRRQSIFLYRTNSRFGASVACHRGGGFAAWQSAILS